jgi:hypothetical protein
MIRSPGSLRDAVLAIKRIYGVITEGGEEQIPEAKAA